MKLLVTGGAGFIGANFIHYWRNKHAQDQIVNLDKLTYAGNLESLSRLKNDTQYTFIKGDICDPVVVEKAMSEVDIVVHFAAESHVDRSINEPSVFVKTNVLGTQVLLNAALKAKVKKFHHVSTDEVFGSLVLDSQDKFSESTCFAPNSPYAASKAGSDHLVRAYFKTYGLSVTISNTSNNFGPYQFPEKLIPLAITNILTGKKVPVYGDGKNVRDWLYVEDHCRGIDLCLEKGRIGETYCLGGMTEDVNNLQVVLKIIKILGQDKSMIDMIKDRPGHDRRYALDWSKAQKDLGYQPKHDFDTYLEKTVNWYQENQNWWQQVKSGEYQDFYQKWYGERL